nr:MAG TPA: hypothetical protein [Bacteriophage sp.]
MKIRPKQGTELEKVLTEMNVRMKQEENEAKDIIEAYCGTRPDTIGYNWAFGFTAVWNYRLIGFNDETFIPAKLLRNCPTTNAKASRASRAANSRRTSTSRSSTTGFPKG